MLKQIFPVVGDERKLPFYVIGLAADCWQQEINRPDGHPTYQLFIARLGEGELTVDGKTYKVRENTAFFLPYGYPHSYKPVSNGWYLDWVSFGGEYAPMLLENWGFNGFEFFSDYDTSRMHRIVNKMYYTLKSDKLYGNHYASAQLYDLLIEFRRGADKRQSMYDSQPYAIANVLEYMEEHYREHLKLNDLAKAAQVTEQHLCRLFKKSFKLRPMEYLAQYRVAQAKDLLVQTNKPICEISDEVGFQDSSYFSVVFKKYEKMTPGEYRGHMNKPNK